MKVLVTGANGFLASNIIRELLHRNIEVRGMIRAGSNVRSIEDLDIELIKGEIIHRSDVMKAVEGCDVIIHTAANTSQQYSDWKPLYPINVEGTGHVVEAAKKYAVKRLIFISTVNTMGLDNDDAETDSLSRLYRKSGYAMSKFKAEELIGNEIEGGNLDAVIVRPSFMIGAYDAKPSSGRLILHCLKHTLTVLPPGGKNFIDVTCAATAICNAITMGEKGKKYVLAGVNLTFASFFKLVRQRENKPARHIQIPSFLLISAGMVGSLLRCFGIRAELNYYNAVILTRQEDLSGEVAEQTLLLPKTDMIKAINDAVSWYKKHDYLD